MSIEIHKNNASVKKVLISNKVIVVIDIWELLKQVWDTHDSCHYWFNKIEQGGCEWVEKSWSTTKKKPYADDYDRDSYKLTLRFKRGWHVIYTVNNRPTNLNIKQIIWTKKSTYHSFFAD